MLKVVYNCFQLWLESALDALNLLFLRLSRVLPYLAWLYLVVAYLVSYMSSCTSWMSGNAISLSRPDLVTHFSSEQSSRLSFQVTSSRGWSGLIFLLGSTVVLSKRGYSVGRIRFYRQWMQNWTSTSRHSSEEEARMVRRESGRKKSRARAKLTNRLDSTHHLGATIQSHRNLAQTITASKSTTSTTATMYTGLK